ATNGGIVNATQNNTTIVNTLATGAATALNVANTTIGASGLTFRSISAPSATTDAGIILINTGSSGGLVVTGLDGVDGDTLPDPGSGGTIAHKTGGNAWSFSGGVPT